MRSVIIQPMTWIKERDIEEVEPVSERDAEVLHDLREVLRRHNALARCEASRGYPRSHRVG